MAGTNNGGGMPKTQGKFGSKEDLIKFIAACGKRCEKLRAIAEKAGVSRSYVVNILREKNIVREKQIQLTVERDSVNRATIEYFKDLAAKNKAQLAERDAKIASQQKELSR